MSQTLPLTIQYCYVALQICLLIGAAVWTLIYVRRYMNRTEKMMGAMYALSVAGQEESRRNQAEMREAVAKLAAAMESLGTAQKMAMGVNVASSLLPMIISELTKSNGGTGHAKTRK